MENIKDEKVQSVAIVREENKEFWLFTKIKAHAKEKPKKTFIIMFSLVALSFIGSVGQLIYVRMVAVPEYEKMKKTNIFEKAGNSLTAPIEATETMLDIRQAMKELEYFKVKKNLTKQDSIRIIYLIDKYKLKAKK